jgi:hypothetical protein
MHPVPGAVLPVHMAVVQVVDVVGMDDRVVTALRAVRVLVFLGGSMVDGSSHVSLLQTGNRSDR